MPTNNIILYSTNCPKCNVLEAKLKQKNIPYEICTDIDIMQSKGMMSAPALEINGELMGFGAAVKWVNEYEEVKSKDIIEEETIMQDSCESCSL